jgi:hypothetical protein
MKFLALAAAFALPLAAFAAPAPTATIPDDLAGELLVS